MIVSPAPAMARVEFPARNTAGRLLGLMLFGWVIVAAGITFMLAMEPFELLSIVVVVGWLGLGWLILHLMFSACGFLRVDAFGIEREQPNGTRRVAWSDVTRIRIRGVDEGSQVLHVATGALLGIGVVWSRWHDTPPSTRPLDARLETIGMGTTGIVPCVDVFGRARRPLLAMRCTFGWDAVRALCVAAEQSGVALDIQ